MHDPRNPRPKKQQKKNGDERKSEMVMMRGIWKGVWDETQPNDNVYIMRGTEVQAKRKKVAGVCDLLEGFKRLVK